MAEDGSAMWRAWPQECSCGDPKDINLRDILQEEGSQITVATGGKFPCLHIVVSGLLQDRRYLLALDFSEMFTDANKRFQYFTEPYYMHRPNHLEGRDWMTRVLYFNLTSIVNGGLQESGMTLASNSEYAPTLRIMGSGVGGSLSSSPAIRIALKESELLAVSLKSEALNNMGNLARQFLLLRRYEMKSDTSYKNDLISTFGPPRNENPRPAQGRPNPQPVADRRRFSRRMNSLHPYQDPGLTNGAQGVTSYAHPIVDSQVRFTSMSRPQEDWPLSAPYPPVFCVQPLQYLVYPWQRHLTPRPGGHFDHFYRRHGMSSRCKRNFSRTRVPAGTPLVVPSECLLPAPLFLPLYRARLALPLLVNGAFVGLY